MTEKPTEAEAIALVERELGGTAIYEVLDETFATNEILFVQDVRRPSPWTPADVWAGGCVIEVTAE
jgi:hypothetical protein